MENHLSAIDLILLLQTQPAHTPFNALPLPLRTLIHDSWLVWVATPSPYALSSTKPCRFLLRTGIQIFIFAPVLNPSAMTSKILRGLKKSLIIKTLVVSFYLLEKSMIRFGSYCDDYCFCTHPSLRSFVTP